MSDLIRIVELEVFCHLGVPDAERREAQRLLISLDMSVATIAHAAKTDDIGRTINYHDVAQRIKALATKRPRKLLETLAEELASEVLKSYPVQKVALEIKKFILADTKHVALRIERTSPTVH